jgi:hypothetical protein
MSRTASRDKLDYFDKIVNVFITAFFLFNLLDGSLVRFIPIFLLTSTKVVKLSKGDLKGGSLKLFILRKESMLLEFLKILISLFTLILVKKKN